MIGIAAFRRVTNPSSVAVVGASDNPGSYGWRVMKIAREYGRPRRLYVVNPARAGTDVQGVTAHASLRDLPEPPECTIVIVPPLAVAGVLEDMAAVGARTGVILSAPHGSGVIASTAFNRQIAEVASNLDLDVIGPNSMGLISAVNRFAATFGSGMLSEPGDPDPAPAGGIAMLSQSGAAISYLLEELRGTGVGYSHLVSTGNEASVTLTDLLECLLEDDSTNSIVLFIEAVSDGRRLRDALARARGAGKAVALLRIGRSDAGRVAAQSHSGRLAGTTGPYQALADDLGVIYVESYEHLFDTVRMLGAAARGEGSPVGAARRAAVITTSGGAAVAAIDELALQGWTVPGLSTPLRDKLDKLLGATGHDNPFDLLGLWKDEWRMAETIRLVASSGEVDAVIAALGGGGSRAAEVCTRAVEAAQADRGSVPVVFASIGLRRDARNAIEAAGGLLVTDLGRAARVLNDRLLVVGGVHARPVELEQSEPAPTVSHVSLPAGVVLARLTAAGVACVDTLVVDPPTLGAVRLAAEDLGFPVVLKLEHHDLLHKTDAGGVVVDIRSVDELAAACAKLRAVAAAATLEGFRLVVQRMVSGVEVIVGAKRDESFGHVLVVGAGGTHAELINDVRLALLPVDANRVSRLIRENSRLMRLLSGYRGTAAVDLNALERQILAIADWIVGQGDAILEFDANPVIVTRDRALVVDARAVFAERSVP